MDTGLEAGPFAFLADGPVHFLAGLFHHVLDPGGMDPAVGDQLFQCQTGNFPADRVKAGNGDGFGSVINNQIHTGNGFQSADVPAFTADDSALHLIVGQVHNRNRGFGCMVGSTALDGSGNHFSGLFIGLILHLCFNFLDLHGSFVANVIFDGLQQALLGLLLGQTGNLFQLFQVLLLDLLHLCLGLIHISHAAGELFFFSFKGIRLFVQRFFLLLETAFLLAQFRATLFDFFFVFGTGSVDFILGFQEHFLFTVFAAVDCFIDNPRSLLFSRADFPFSDVSAIGNTGKERKGKQKNCTNNDQYDLEWSHSLSTPPS